MTQTDLKSFAEIIETSVSKSVQNAILSIAEQVKDLLLPELKNEVRKTVKTTIDLELYDRLDLLPRETFGDKIAKLPTKAEFAAGNAELMKELKDMREEKDILSAQQSQHTDRIDRIERHLRLPAASV